MPRESLYPRWMSIVLIAAGIYNLLWGTWVVLFPTHSFAASGLQWPDKPLVYPQLWQCIGMIVGVYGIGYLAASTNPVRHWPVVLVGFLGKIFGPIGYVQAAMNGDLPWESGITNFFNDVIWWVPFFLILRRSYEVFRTEAGRPTGPTFEHLAESMRTTDGRTIAELSNTQPRLIVFVRHFGCIFCREALADLAQQRSAIEATGTGLLIVHMGSAEEGKAFLDRYQLGDIPHISDPECDLYRAIGLERGTLNQLLGWRSWWRGAGAFFRQRHGVGKLVGDGFRMPGVFLVEKGRVVRAFRHKSAADRPDYVALTHCPVPTAEPSSTREAS